MEIPMTPPQVAKQLGVATVTVYKWIEAKKLPATHVPTGQSTRIFIDPQDVELKRIELEQAALRVDENTPEAEPTEMQWVRQYQDLLGKLPRLYVAFRHGKATFEQMKDDARKCFDSLR